MGDETHTFSNIRAISKLENKLIPSPPAYIAPMPIDLYTDDEDSEDNHIERPNGREIIFPETNEMERLVVTSSIELRSIYSFGFEEWKPSQSWTHNDSKIRETVSLMFRS